MDQAVLRKNILQLSYDWFSTNPSYLNHRCNRLVEKGLPCEYNQKDKEIVIKLERSGRKLTIVLKRDQNNNRVVNFVELDEAITFKRGSRMFTVAGAILEHALLFWRDHRFPMTTPMSYKELVRKEVVKSLNEELAYWIKNYYYLHRNKKGIKRIMIHRDFITETLGYAGTRIMSTSIVPVKDKDGIDFDINLSFNYDRNTDLKKISMSVTKENSEPVVLFRSFPNRASEKSLQEWVGRSFEMALRNYHVEN